MTYDYNLDPLLKAYKRIQQLETYIADLKEFYEKQLSDLKKEKPFIPGYAFGVPCEMS